MFTRLLAAALAVTLPSAAFAACTQADLKGKWRFNFDLNRTITIDSIERVQFLSCVLNIKADGTITPGECETVNNSGDPGSFFIAPSARKLVMKTSNCTAMFSGDIVFTNDFGLALGNVTYFVNGAKLSISPDKQMLLGWLSVSGKPWSAVTAMKIATP
jgi:hypothetical protein